MKKVYASFIIFISMIIIIIFSVSYLHKIYSIMEPLNSQLEEAIVSENWDKSSNLVHNLDNEWQKHSNTICMFVHHAEIDDISSEVTKLTQYINYHNKDDSMASLHVIKFFFQHILNLEKISIQNIL